MKKKMLSLIACVLVLLMATSCSKSVEQQVMEQLELGQKYLAELNYEEAIVAFQKIIELDPKNVEAYLAMDKVYMDQGDYENAIRILVQGYAATENAKLYELQIEHRKELGQNYLKEAMENAAEEENYYWQAMEIFEQIHDEDPSDEDSCEMLLNIYKWFGDLDKLQELLDRHQGEQDGEELKGKLADLRTCLELIKRISDLCEKDDITSVFDLMNGEEYKKLQDFAEEIDHPAFVLKGEKGLGIYSVSTEEYGNSMIYYGDYQDGMRHGDGYWLGYYEGNNYQAYGQWNDDVPNGRQEVKEWNGNLAEAVSVRLISGPVSGGLWNGSVLWEFDYNDGRGRHTHPVEFVNGKWVILREEESDNGVRYIVSESGEDEGGTGLMETKTPNLLEGIEGFR